MSILCENCDFTQRVVSVSSKEGKDLTDKYGILTLTCDKCDNYCHKPTTNSDICFTPFRLCPETCKCESHPCESSQK